MWLDRMMKRSNTKKQADNAYVSQDEETLKKRIVEDLVNRGCKANSNKEYPLGTVSVVEEANTVFYLLAASKFDSNNNAHATKEQISQVLNSLVKFYDRNGQGQDLYVPLIGTGMSRSGLSNRESFDEIYKVFNPETNSFVGKVTVVVLPDACEKLNIKD